MGEEHIAMSAQRAERVDVAIVGAGQAGLATAYFLTRKGVSNRVLERGRIGESWRSMRWESFRINSTNKVNGLPGTAYQGPQPDSFISAKEHVENLEAYAAAHAMRVVTGTEVVHVERTADGDFNVHTRSASGEAVFNARHVVAATGSFSVPRMPALAHELPRDVTQFTAGTYRSPRLLPEGAALVVGSGDSGCQIAEDLLDAGRRVYLCTSFRRRVPRRYRGRDFCDWAVMSGRWDATLEMVTDRRILYDPDAPLISGVYGGHTLSYQGMEHKGAVLLGKLTAVEGQVARFDGRVNDYVAWGDETSAQFKKSVDAYISRSGLAAPAPELDPLDEPDTNRERRPVLMDLDLHAKRIASVIWCTGFTYDFSWLKVPVFDREGRPVHTRGIAPVEGVYFVGLHWLHTQSSGLIYGVGRDAEFLASCIERRLTQS